MGPVALLIVINLILFVASLVNSDFIFSQFGLQPASFGARPWTIITNLFIHNGIGHILPNMLTLYLFGSYLTRLIGERNFLIVYFLGGIAGNILYIFLAPPYSIAVGASGAIFAVGGTLTVLRPNLTVFIFPIPVPLPLWLAVIGGFLVLSFVPGVAWQAHLGGLVLGLVIALFFRGKERRVF